MREGCIGFSADMLFGGLRCEDRVESEALIFESSWFFKGNCLGRVVTNNQAGCRDTLCEGES